MESSWIRDLNFGAVGLILTESENHSALSGVTRFAEIHIPFRDDKMEWESPLNVAQ